MDLKGIEGILCQIHLTLAAVTRTPELALSEAEAANLARALAQVGRHYNMPAVAPKVVDHVNFAIVLLAIYSPRFAAIKIRKAREEAHSEPQGIQWPTASVLPETSSLPQ